MKFVHSPQRFADSAFAKIIARELESRKQHLATRTDPDRIARALRELKTGKALGTLSNADFTRLEALLTELPRLIVSYTERRRVSLEHLFSGDARTDPARIQYQRRAREFQRLLEGKVAPELRRPGGVLERHAQLLYDQLSGTFDDYDSLVIETKTFNELLRMLYPRQIRKEEVLDAHHIIEERFYEKFQDIWKLLGWESAGSMPALALPKEYHRRSPKRLQGIKKLAQEVDGGEGVSSLSRELQKVKALDKAKSPEQLIEIYIEFYKYEANAKDAVPVLRAIKAEIKRRRFK